MGDPGPIPGLERSPREGDGYPLQYSGLENFIGYSVLGVAKSGTLSLLPYPRPQCSESIPGPLVLLLLLECSSPGAWWQMPHLLLAKCHLLCKAFPDSSAESSKLGLPWWSELRLHAFIAGGAGSIPGPVSEIRQASGAAKKKKAATSPNPAVSFALADLVIPPLYLSNLCPTPPERGHHGISCPVFSGTCQD